MLKVVHVLGRPISLVCAALVLTAVFAVAKLEIVEASSGGCCGAVGGCAYLSDFCTGSEDCFAGDCCYGGACGI